MQQILAQVMFQIELVYDSAENEKSADMYLTFCDLIYEILASNDWISIT